MARMFIPEIGTRLWLEAAWTFDLHFERRNEKFGTKHGIVPDPGADRYSQGWYLWWQAEKSTPFTLPERTILKVDRIYIRQGADEYSSVSFYAYDSAKVTSKGPKCLGRFWAKLSDVNTIEYTVLGDESQP